MKEYIKELFTAKGRLNRMKFFINTFLLPIVIILISWFILSLSWHSKQADIAWYESSKSNLTNYVIVQETIWLSQEEIENLPKYIELSQEVEEYENKIFGKSSPFASIIIIIYILLPLTFYVIIVSNIKRLHDLWKTWFYVFLNFVPLIGFIFSLYLLLKKWDEWKNKYGEDPLMKNQEELTAI